MESFLVFEKEAKEATSIYKKMTFIIEDGCPVLFGFLDLFDKNGVLQDSYKIKIKPKDDYPFSFPYVYEIEGKIPKNVDWHIFEDEGNFCIASQPEEILICKKGLTLISFIEYHLIPYLFNQSFRRINGFFLNERPHGDQGWIEFFEDELKTKNISNIIFVLEKILARNIPDRRSYCFCESGVKFRNCHKGAFIKFLEFSDEQLIWFINRLKMHKNLGLF